MQSENDLVIGCTHGRVIALRDRRLKELQAFAELFDSVVRIAEIDALAAELATEDFQALEGVIERAEELELSTFVPRDLWNDDVSPVWFEQETSLTLTELLGEDALDRIGEYWDTPEGAFFLIEPGQLDKLRSRLQRLGISLRRDDKTIVSLYGKLGG